jgi:hypothetical protein
MILSKLNESIFKYGASAKSSALLAANTAETAVAAAANVNGLILHAATFYTKGAPTPTAVLVANASAPATPASGDNLLQVSNLSGGGSIDFMGGSSLVGSIYIPAGKGLYWISGSAESAGGRSILYTLL